MPITDLTGTTWIINDTWASLPSGISVEGYTGDAKECNINFTSNGVDYIRFDLFDRDYSEFLAYKPSSGSSVRIVDYSWNWTNNAYKTISITGGTEVTNSQVISWFQANATLQVEPEPDIILQKTTLCMKKAFPGGEVTDLTGTTWLLNSSVDVSLGESFEIGFNSNSTIFNYMNIDDRGRIQYRGNSQVNAYEDDVWLSEAYRTIEITGGTDAINSTLINWLQNNATLVSGGPVIYRLVPVSVMRKVSGGELTDLTGTTWVFNDVPSTYSSTTTTFNLNFKYGDLLPSASSLILTSSGKIVYRPEGLSIDEIGYVQTDASWTNMGWGIWNNVLEEFSPNTSYKTIQITGGTDATNSNLITYLQQNATLTSGGSSDTLQPVNLFSTIEVQAPSGCNITITFQNGVDTSAWQSTKIYKNYTTTVIDGKNYPSVHSSDEIGSISSANGSSVVTTNTDKIFILSKSSSFTETYGNISVSSTITTTGYQSQLYSGTHHFTASSYVLIDNVSESLISYYIIYEFSVSGDGTITISGADWED